MEGEHGGDQQTFGAAVLVTKKPSAGPEALAAALRQFSDVVSEGLGATVRAAVHREDDPYENGLGGRCQDGRIDGIADFRFASAEVWAELLDRLLSAREILLPVIQAGRSTVVVGDAHRLIDRGIGDCVFAFALRRDPGIGQEELRKWWLTHHSAWLRVPFSRHFRTYEAMIADEERSGFACAVLGFEGSSYEFYEYNTADSLEEVASGTLHLESSAFKDEIGYIDHERGFRTGWLEEVGEER